MRQIIQGYLLTQEDRLLGREEFHSMLLLAARIVKSTLLHDAPESPNESQPSPHHLITHKKDNLHTEKYSRPSNYTHQDLLAYRSNSWKRIEALAYEFARYWKHYVYQIGNNKEKWYNPQRNARIGDIVLLKEKTTPRLDWPAGLITSITTDKDGLVRRVYVQPHKKQGQTSAPQLKERAIHDLVLIKALCAQDNPYPDSITIKTAPSEAKILKSSFTPEDRKILWNDPQESPYLCVSEIQRYS